MKLIFFYFRRVSGLNYPAIPCTISRMYWGHIHFVDEAGACFVRYSISAIIYIMNVVKHATLSTSEYRYNEAIMYQIPTICAADTRS